MIKFRPGSRKAAAKTAVHGKEVPLFPSMPEGIPMDLPFCSFLIAFRIFSSYSYSCHILVSTSRRVSKKNHDRQTSTRESQTCTLADGGKGLQRRLLWISSVGSDQACAKQRVQPDGWDRAKFALNQKSLPAKLRARLRVGDYRDA